MSTERQKDFLTITAEECAEVIQCVTKALRTGKLQHNQRLMEEIADVEIMFAILSEQNLVDRQFIDEYKRQKRAERG